MDARTGRIIEWALEHKTQLQLSVKHFTWTQNWLPTHFDILVSINHDGRTYSGRGTDTNENMAFLKAFVEAVERTLILRNNFKHSNGIALHVDFKSAQRNALHEFIERDRFLCHYLTQTPFCSINNLNNIFLKSQDPELQSYLKCMYLIKEKEIDVQLVEMRRIGTYFSTVCLADGKKFPSPFGICLGMGCETSLGQSLKKAMMECFRHVITFVESEENLTETLSIEEFNKIECVMVEDHIKMTNHPEYKNNIWNFWDLKSTADSIPLENEEILESIKITQLELPEIFKDLPLVGVHAGSQLLHNLYFGTTTENKVNLSRLSQFCGREISFDKVFKTPHPIG